MILLMQIFRKSISARHGSERPGGPINTYWNGVPENFQQFQQFHLLFQILFQIGPATILGISEAESLGLIFESRGSYKISVLSLKKFLEYS